VNKLTVYGLPLNPMPALNALRGASFCVSYATRQKLGRQLAQAIELVGEDQMLLVDNGAFTAWKSGVDTMNDEAYLEGFAAWANDILARCPQAVAVLPDVIDGTVEQNAQLVRETMTMFDDCDRLMPIWHLHEPISYLLYLCETFSFVGFGSSGQYASPHSPLWAARIEEAFAAIASWEAESDGAYVRPRIHMMRAQSKHHLYPFDSSDSTNVAVNHGAQRKRGEDLPAFAARVDGKIQASAGPSAPHQVARPLLAHLEAAAVREAWSFEEPELRLAA